ncbi:MAG: hypothetical protein LBC13_02085, partial [Clostridiales bacterium]|nr:hypothetical protein [Clostridiales bacterium]
MFEIANKNGIKIFTLEESDIRGCFSPPVFFEHKGLRGRLVVIGGSARSVGAPFLSAKAAEAVDYVTEKGGSRFESSLAGGHLLCKDAEAVDDINKDFSQPRTRDVS